MKNDKQEITVFISLRDSTCSECKENLGHHAWITLNREKGALCLSCADLDHLTYLPSGDAALTRRSKKYSTLYAVVLLWSRTRKQYERQGLLVEQEALDKAEKECLADSDLREQRRIREAERREELDQKYITEFARQIRQFYPACPKQREFTIAEHACMKYTGRVGRSAAAKEFSENAILLAVRAHIRHRETNYDEFLMQGFERYEARERVEEKVEHTLQEWQKNG